MENSELVSFCYWNILFWLGTLTKRWQSCGVLQKGALHCWRIQLFLITKARYVKYRVQCSKDFNKPSFWNGYKYIFFLEKGALGRVSRCTVTEFWMSFGCARLSVTFLWFNSHLNKFVYFVPLSVAGFIPDVLVYQNIGWKTMQIPRIGRIDDIRFYLMTATFDLLQSLTKIAILRC